jgi:hypothetical protein
MRRFVHYNAKKYVLAENSNKWILYSGKGSTYIFPLKCVQKSINTHLTDFQNNVHDTVLLFQKEFIATYDQENKKLNALCKHIIKFGK